MRYGVVKNYVAGQWREADCAGYVDVENPSTSEPLAQTPLSTAAEVNRAIEAAAKAFVEWRDVPASRRVQPIMPLVALLRASEQRLTRGISEEMGKSLPDARMVKILSRDVSVHRV